MRKPDVANYAALQAVRTFIEAGVKLVATSHGTATIIEGLEADEVEAMKNDFAEGVALLEENLKARTNETLVDHLLQISSTLARFPAHPYVTHAEAFDEPTEDAP